jgi:hypothetical protein
MLHGYEISKVGYLLIYRFNLIDLLALEDKLMYAFTLYNVTTVLAAYMLRAVFPIKKM